MINAKKFGDTVFIAYQKGGKVLNLFPLRLQKGDQRLDNISEIGGVIYG